MDLEFREKLWVGHMGLGIINIQAVICLQRIWFEKTTEIKQKHPLTFIPIFRGAADKKKKKTLRGGWGRIVKAEKE